MESRKFAGAAMKAKNTDLTGRLQASGTVGS
jgi:hypothetical protein